MLASTRSSNSVRTISGKGAVFIEARVTGVTHHKGRIYVRSFTQLTFYTTESLGGLRNKRSTYTYSQRLPERFPPTLCLHQSRSLRAGLGTQILRTFRLLIYPANSGRIRPLFLSHHFSKARQGFMEINPIVTKIKELRERTEALRGYL